MPWPPEDPDMWAVEAAFGKHNKKDDVMKINEPGWLDKNQKLIKDLAPPPANHQVGGDHYAKMAIQPSRFAMANDYDFDAGSCLKYLSRHRAKDGKAGVEKAMSFIDIRLDNYEFVMRPRFSAIPIGQYIHENGFDHLTCHAIRDLHDWVISGNGGGPLVDHLRHSIKLILGTYR